MSMERFPVDATFEVRAVGDKREIRGYAAVFEQLSGDLGGFREKIAPGAFAGGLGGDIRALWNHNADHVLGRTSAGTLRLVEDAKGLRVEIDPPASAGAFVESLQRGDVITGFNGAPVVSICGGWRLVLSCASGTVVAPMPCLGFHCCAPAGLLVSSHS